MKEAEIIFNELRELLKLKIQLARRFPDRVEEPPMVYQKNPPIKRVAEIIDLPSEIFPESHIFTPQQLFTLNFLLEEYLELMGVIIHLNPIFPHEFRYNCLVNIFTKEVKFLPNAILQFHFCSPDFSHCMVEGNCICRHIKQFLSGFPLPVNFDFKITD